MAAGPHPWDAPDTKTVRLSVAVALSAASCAPNPRDRCETSPNDGSVNANSADIVGNPAMPSNAPKPGK
ncbi:MAG: hypothetical protein FJ260_02915 [Planctomycetes bacterium]|nr:hypothetical protein [Planctomycetota bacterium]